MWRFIFAKLFVEEVPNSIYSKQTKSLNLPHSYKTNPLLEYLIPPKY